MKKYSSILLVTVIVVIAVLLVIKNTVPMAKDNDNDKYESFNQLSQNEKQNVDYNISLKKTNSDVLLMAIHGGSIEPGTTQLVEQIALEDNYSYYAFQGIKTENNADLHITSTNFNEPKALDLASNSLYTLSFHGYGNEKNKQTYIGGLDRQLAETIRVELEKAGFSVNDAPKGINGKEKDNIVNKNKRKKGVQIEISTAQRKAFFTNDDFSSANRKNKTKEFYAYVNAIQEALSK